MSVTGLRADPLEEVVELLQALAAPVRLAVITELRSGPRCVHELIDALTDAGRDVRQPLMSQHLRVLRSPASSPPSAADKKLSTASPIPASAS